MDDIQRCQEVQRACYQHLKMINEMSYSQVLEISDTDVSIVTGNLTNSLDRSLLQSALFNLQFVNILRDEIVNFPYVYYVGIQSDRLHIAQEVLSQHTLRDVMSGICQFRSLLLQVLFALQYTHELNQFVHGNLTVDNIRVNHISPVVIVYPEIELHTKQLAKITNFEHSEIGSTKHPLTDVFTLLQSCKDVNNSRYPVDDYLAVVSTESADITTLISRVLQDIQRFE